MLASNMYVFAQAYGSSNYDTSTYDTNTSGSSGSTGSTGSTSSGSSSGSAAGSNAGGSTSLTNTGFDLLLIATLACVIVFAAILVRFWKKKPARTA
jgi:hypothetical protein